MSPKPIYENATGNIPYPLTNDYLFRAFLQENQKALIGLVSSVFHIDPNEIESIQVANPIELGKSIDNKDFIFDLKVKMIPDKILMLEMQVSNEYNWAERSLSYICREFDNVAKGCNYTSVTPVYQLSFLDFTLFPEHVKFYSTYKLLEKDDYHLYSSKFAIHMIDLNHIELATEEDKQYKIDQWARFFKAKTWEALKMLAKENEFIASATETVYKLSADEKIRQQCEAREEYYRIQRGMQDALAEAREENERIQRGMQDALAEKDKQIAELQAKLAELQK